MWKKIKPLLILLSVALNVAFVTIWAAHSLPTHLRGPSGPGPGRGEGIRALFHRRLGVTEAQWREIEPRLAEFRKSARPVCDELNRARAELIDLIAAPNPDLKAIRTKQEEILAGQKRIQELVINHLLSEKKTLRGDQQRRLFDMLRRRSVCAGRGPMMGRGGMGPMCPVDDSRDGGGSR